MSTVWRAGDNAPGCIPESEPWSADDYESGVEMLIEQIERAVENAHEDLAEGINVVHSQRVVDEATTAINLIGSYRAMGGNLHVTVDGRVHWLEAQEVSAGEPACLDDA